MPLAGGQPEIVESLALDVDHSMTFPTHQMVMPVDLAVEAGTRAGMM
jgi:hypothetical protein